jgi:2-polyprenyl-3-methyl-5-hydroxy-6-metoxy-1,4-benzoquinol methylase
MIQQVNTNKYDKNYFSTVYGLNNYTEKIDLKDQSNFCRPLSEIIKLSKDDVIVDYGCGVGQLSFYLYAKYKCKIIGIDYSKSAIKECNRNKTNFIKKFKTISTQIQFINKNNNNLPDLQNIKVVYLQDVIEHMFDEEIKMVLEHFKRWNNHKIFIAIKTDNYYYLKFIRPIIDLFLILIGDETIESYKQRINWEKERHINITSVTAFQKILLTKSYKIEKIYYTPFSQKKIAITLGKLGKISLFVNAASFFYKRFTCLRPSFFLLASFSHANPQI